MSERLRKFLSDVELDNNEEDVGLNEPEPTSRLDKFLFEATPITASTDKKIEYDENEDSDVEPFINKVKRNVKRSGVKAGIEALTFLPDLLTLPARVASSITSPSPRQTSFSEMLNKYLEKNKDYKARTTGERVLDTVATNIIGMPIYGAAGTAVKSFGLPVISKLAGAIEAGNKFTPLNVASTAAASSAAQGLEDTGASTPEVILGSIFAGNIPGGLVTGTKVLGKTGKGLYNYLTGKPKGITVIPDRLAAYYANIDPEKLKAFKEVGLEPSLGQVSNSDFVKTLDLATRKGLGADQDLFEKVIKQKEKLLKTAGLPENINQHLEGASLLEKINKSKLGLDLQEENLARRFAAKLPKKKYTVGTEVNKEIESFFKKNPNLDNPTMRKALAENVAGAKANIKEDVILDISKFKERLKDYTDKYFSNASKAYRSKSDSVFKLEKKLDNITKDTAKMLGENKPNYMALSDFEEIQSGLGRQIKDYTQILADKEMGKLKELYGRSSQVIGDNLKKTNPELAKEFFENKKFFSKNRQNFYQTHGKIAKAAKKLGDESGSKVFNMIENDLFQKGSGGSMFKAVSEGMNNKEKRDLALKVIASRIENKDLGKLLDLKKLPSHNREILYNALGKEAADNLEKTMKVLEADKQFLANVNVSGTTPHAEANRIINSLATGSVGKLRNIVSESIFRNTLSKAITNPEYVKKLAEIEKLSPKGFVKEAYKPIENYGKSALVRQILVQSNLQNKLDKKKEDNE
jgi:uncharacterized protein YaaW (UPF0174 family)